MEIIPVSAPGGDYTIVIERGLLKALPERRDAYGLNGQVITVTNPTIQPLYAAAMTHALPQTSFALMPDGEAYKTLATVAQLYTDFAAAGLDRAGTVLALGGGVVGDAAGFAAATYMRGVRLVQMPTTLLAMVDSSVGGKVGVDLPQGKNLVGAFKQPSLVLIDPDVLQTLPPRQWACGMAEALKHGLLADESLLDPALHTPDRAAALVARAVRVKVDVVQRDPYEQGERAHLNLGHTFAHAIEQVSGYRWLHGEAVGVGLIAAARLSHLLGLCDSALPTQVEAIIGRVGLPTRLQDSALTPDALLAAMATDKKWFGGKARFVLLRGIGQPMIMDDVPTAAVLHVLETLN
ncbi:MAG: 3-dehydroquinate synthase [Armatimonadetes bacterium]|nr:3-dehydroquinate synthase [Anaerolineae bacterium]